MRIDDENKVVWCSDANDLAFVDNKTTLVLIEQLIKFDGSYSFCEIQDDYFKSCNNKKIDLLYAILNGYEFKLKQPQKYYWRKKKEHLAWFEISNESYLNVRYEDELILGDTFVTENYKATFTETEARDLLKVDFDKFEKVECE